MSNTLLMFVPGMQAHWGGSEAVLMLALFVAHSCNLTLVPPNLAFVVYLEFDVDAAPRGCP